MDLPTYIVLQHSYPLAIQEHLLFVSTLDGSLHGVNSVNGNLKWSIPGGMGLLINWNHNLSFVRFALSVATDMQISSPLAV